MPVRERTEQDSSPRPKVLLVTASKSCPALLEGLEALGIEILSVHNCSQARRMLEGRLDVRAVLTEVTLSDGDWQTVADAVAASSVNTEVVVLARSIDGKLRRDVMDSGAYDLLVAPYSRGEVGRVVGGAVLTGYRRFVGISGPAVCSVASSTHAA